MTCRRESMLSTGRWLRNSRNAATARTTTTYQSGASGVAGGSAGSSRAGTASTIVIQLSQEKLPDSTSHSWVRIIRDAAAVAIGCGVKSRNGTISWVTWLAATSTRCSGLGSRWKNQLSGPGIGCVSWWWSRQVSLRQQGSPRILIRPAPNSTRNSSQRSRNSTTIGGATSSLPRRTARKPVSSSSDSQPKPYQVWPTLTIDTYSAHGTSHASMAAHSGSSESRPAISAADTAQPAQAHPAKNRSEQRQWNTLGARRNGTRSTNRATGSIPRSPSSARNCSAAVTNATRYTQASARWKTVRLSQ